MLILTAAVSLMLAQAAEPAAAKPAPAAAAEKPAKPKRICRDEVEMGSVIPRRVCRTPEQLEIERRNALESSRARGDHDALCRGRSC